MIMAKATMIKNSRIFSEENTMSLIVEGVAIPDSKLARELTELVKDNELPLLFHHSSRVYYWGAGARGRRPRARPR